MANTFLAHPGAMQAPLRAAATIRRRQSPATRAADRPTTNAPTPATPDNPPPPAKCQRNHPPSKGFSRTLDKKMQPRTPQNAQDAKKGTKKGARPEPGSGAIEAAISIPLVLDKATIAGADAKLGQQIPSQTLDKSAPQTVTSGPLKAPPVVLQAAKKPLTTGPDQAVPDTAPTTDADRGGPEPIAPAMSGAQSQAGADSGPMQVSDKAFVPKELLPDAAAGDQGEPVAGKKPVITGEPAPSPHTQVEVPAKAVITSLHSAQANQPAAADGSTTPKSSPIPADSSATPAESSATPAESSPTPAESSTTPAESSPTPVESSPTPVESSPTPAEHLLAPKVPSTPGNTAAQLPNSPSAAPDDQASRSTQNAPIRSENPSQAAEHTTPEEAVIDHKGLPDKTQPPAVQQRNTSGVGTVPGKSIAQKAGQPGSGALSSQADNRGSLLSSGGGSPNAEPGEQAVIGNTAPADITEQSPASAGPARPAANAGSRSAVAEQIMESVRTSISTGLRQIVIRLNPPELGKVAITFREGADGITGLLQVDEPQTRHQLQHALPEIIQNLQDSGVGIKRLDVQLTDQHQQYNAKDQSAAAGQDGWSGQQSSTDPDSQRNNTTYNEWLTNIDTVPEFAETQVQFTDSSINMLV